MDSLSTLWYYLFMPFGDLVFLHSNRTVFCDAHVDKWFDGYWTLQFAAEGGVEAFYDDTHYLLPAGEAWFWPAYPGPHIRFHPTPGRLTWDHRYVAFQGPRVVRWIAEGLYPTVPQRAPFPAAEGAARFDALLALIRQPDRWGPARAVNLLESLLLEMAEARNASVPQVSEEPWLTRLLSRLETGDDFSLDYDAFARSYGMATSTLRRRFRNATGTPLHEYALQARIARARDLLGETDLPVKAIAEQLGYGDVYFFTRQFRQSVGVPPATWRKSRQG
jgi:AraC-like DNA-binding protein